MEPMLVTTEQFWGAMCDPSFVRLSMLTGRMRGQLIVTLEAPEQRSGFLQAKIDRTLLKLRP